MAGHDARASRARKAAPSGDRSGPSQGNPKGRRASKQDRSSCDHTSSEEKNLYNQLQEKDNEIARLKRKLKKVEGDNDNLRRQLAEFERKAAPSGDSSGPCHPDPSSSDSSSSDRSSSDHSSSDCFSSDSEADNVLRYEVLGDQGLSAAQRAAVLKKMKEVGARRNFVAVMKENNVQGRDCFLVVSEGFANATLKTKLMDIIFQIPGSMKKWMPWLCKRDGVYTRRRQWAKFVSDNDLGEGDICIISLLD